MREIQGDIWDYHGTGAYIVITTNGSTTHDGLAVMGRGVALQAAMRFPQLRHQLGSLIKLYGNYVFIFSPWKIITLPVKNDWKEDADLHLIRRSINELYTITRAINISPIYMVRPGCGNGRLKWQDVQPILKSLEDRFVVVERNP